VTTIEGGGGKTAGVGGRPRCGSAGKEKRRLLGGEGVVLSRIGPRAVGGVCEEGSASYLLTRKGGEKSRSPSA